MRTENRHKEYIDGEKYRNLPFGTVYFVAGTASKALNTYVEQHTARLAGCINEDEGTWVTCQVVYLEAANPLFPPREQGTLYSALLPEEDAEAENAFLAEPLYAEDPQRIMYDFIEFFDALQRHFDAALDGEKTGDEELEEPDRMADTLQESADECSFGAAYEQEWMPDAAPCEPEMMSDAVPCEPEMKKSAWSGGLFAPFAKRAKTAETCHKKEVQEAPSRLEITPETYQILLPDYHREIHFTAQVKALYVLFLNHPDGIRMKEIADYKEEYKQLYFNLTNRSDTDKLRGSVERLLDVCNPNALNVKKSQCNEALRQVLPERERRYYYEIEVNRGLPHRIPLDRSLVTMPVNLQI